MSMSPMKRFAILAGTLATCCASGSCVVQTTYIGKAYPATEATDLFFSWNDVPDGYETMGHIQASPRFFGTLEKAQNVIEKRAREKGADAVVFDKNRRKARICKKEDGQAQVPAGKPAQEME